MTHKFHRGYKFKTPIGRIIEIVNYDDTDELYICHCTTIPGLSIEYWDEKEIEEKERVE